MPTVPAAQRTALSSTGESSLSSIGASIPASSAGSLCTVTRGPPVGSRSRSPATTPVGSQRPGGAPPSTRVVLSNVSSARLIRSTAASIAWWARDSSAASRGWEPTRSSSA